MVALGFCVAPASLAQEFRSDKVELFARVSLAQFGSQHENGNGCWGYVAPSGREYALMGVSGAIAVVEITNPTAPVIVGQIAHYDSLWADVKVYRSYAYAVNESGNGVQVIDLTRVDDGVVSLVREVRSNGLWTSHNIALDPVSGFAYPVGSNIANGGLIMLNLSNPSNPQWAGAWTDNYVHDAQVVTYESGRYAGRQVAFCCIGGGLKIVDVTDKARPITLSHFTYPNQRYTHQGWLTEDRTHFLIDDELDELRGQPFTRTIIVNVEDLANPRLAAEYTNGVRATDHNLYIHGLFAYEANYKSGLRVLDVSDPTAPFEVGFFDTFPDEDASPELGFNGAWSTFPFFPSGTVIVSDMQYGLFVLDARQARSGLNFSYPQGRPDAVSTAGGTVVRVEVAARHAEPEPATGKLHVDYGAGVQTVAMTPVSEHVYDAHFPATTCGQFVRYAFSVESTDGIEVQDPFSTSASFYEAFAGDAPTLLIADDFETDAGWTVTHDKDWTDGAWARATPPTSDRGNPSADFDGSGRCFLTGGSDVQRDVDGGATVLTSPKLDLAATLPVVRYARWFYNDDDDEDRLIVEVSGDDGETWVEVESTRQAGGWRTHQFRLADYVVPSAEVRMRFTVADRSPGSTTEAAVDAFQVLDPGCDFPCDVVLRFAASCSSRGKVKATVKSGLPAGAVMHATIDGSEPRLVTINARGKGKTAWNGRFGSVQVCLLECPGLCDTAECP
ncbi:MAG: hypothetical protein AMXMBFR22_23710 [Phycisphaerae bacterium]